MCLGIPGKIVEFVDEQKFFAKVDVSGVKRNVNTALLAEDGLQPGDWVLVHVGFAMSKLDEEEAHKTLELLKQMDSLFEEELSLFEQSQADNEVIVNYREPEIQHAN
jgi:hydrogenase expression/formation protein HypC